MTRRLITFLFVLALAVPATGATEILVTVTEKKSGAPVTELTAADFTVITGKTEHRVTGCRFEQEAIDIVLMVDASSIGEAVTSLAPALVDQLEDKEQMAIVAYSSSADLIQEFTSSKNLLRRALSQVKFGNSPRLMDAIYASIEDGFEGASFRRVILLLTSGVDGPGRVSTRELIRTARRRGVSLYPVFLMTYGRSLLERLARETGGAMFNLRQMSNSAGGSASAASRIFTVMRSHYTLTLPGNLPLGENLKVRLKRKNKKLLVSYLELN